MKVGIGNVEDGDVPSISVINDCTGNGNDAFVDAAVIIDTGDGDIVADVDVCAISVGTMSSMMMLVLLLSMMTSVTVMM